MRLSLPEVVALSTNANNYEILILLKLLFFIK